MTLKNGDYKLSIEKRVTTLEIGLNEVGSDVKEIRDNHLAHLADKVDKIHWLIITTLITGLVSVVSKFI